MTWIDAGMHLSLAAAAAASILSMMMLQEKHNYESYSSKQTAMAAHLKAIESDRILNQINSNIMDAAYELQDFMCDYDESEIRIIVTTDGITAERIEEEEDY